MKDEEFVQLFCDAIDGLEPEGVQIDTELKTLEEWDSLALLNVLAAVDAECGVQISGQDIAGCGTVGDIKRVVEAKQG